MNPLQLRETTMLPESRRLVQLTIDASDETEQLLDMLLAKKRAGDRRVLAGDQGQSGPDLTRMATRKIIHPDKAGSGGHAALQNRLEFERVENDCRSGNSPRRRTSTIRCTSFSTGRCRISATG